MGDRVTSILWNLAIFGAFMYALLVMHKVIKTSLEMKMLQQPTMFVRALVYLGVFLFGILVVMDILGK